MALSTLLLRSSQRSRYSLARRTLFLLRFQVVRSKRSSRYFSSSFCRRDFFGIIPVATDSRHLIKLELISSRMACLSELECSRAKRASKDGQRSRNASRHSKASQST